MLKNICLILSLLMVLLLFGCGTVDGQETVTTAPTETETIPPDTEPTIPSWPTAANVSLIDSVPEQEAADTETSTIVHTTDDYQATYIYNAETDVTGRIFWKTQEGETVTEIQPGCRYDVYIMEDGQPVKLENKNFSGGYTLFGKTVELAFSYAVYGDEMYITHSPARSSITWAQVWDTSRGVKDCLVRFDLETAQGHICYFAAVDLETGALRDFLAWLDPSAILADEMSVLLWEEDDSLLLLALSENELVYLDAANKRVINFGQENLGKNISKFAFWEGANGLICRARTGTMSSKASVWKLDLKGEMVTPILTDVTPACDFTDGAYVVYLGEDGARYIYDMIAGENIPLFEAVTVRGGTENFVFYLDGAGAYHVFSIEKKEDLAIKLPEGWETTLSWRESPKGDILLASRKDESGTFQLLAFNGRANELIELRRINPNEVQELYVGWTEDGKIRITANEPQAYYIYELFGE